MTRPAREGISWTERGLRVVAAAVLALLAWQLPAARKAFIDATVRHDAIGGPAPRLPAAPTDAAGLSPVPVVRVVLIDGVNLEDARAMPRWSALCARGLDLEVDVGFPTVSLPVQVALWTGLTQQQTGIVYHSGSPLADPLGRRGIPAQVPGSIAIAETHQYIVHSLGFATTLPAYGDGKKGPEGWDLGWVQRAAVEVSGPSPLVFVHVLRVDTAGHKFGRASAEWDAAVATSDTILGELVAAGELAHPGARWFVLADHGHLAGGGHASEERGIRRVRACIAGVGIEPGRGGPIALVDLSRALADSLAGVTLAPAAQGRPLHGAMAAPLTGDELVPTVPRGRAALAALLLLGGALLTAWALGTKAVLWGPWWWPVAIGALLIGLGTPTLSTPFIYKPTGKAIADAAAWGTYLAAGWAAAAVLLAGRPGWRVAIAQIALPLAGVLAALALCGGLPILWGEVVVPIAPRWTAWASVLMVITVRGLWAVALALLATSVLPSSGRVARWGTRRSGS